MKRIIPLAVVLASAWMLPASAAGTGPLSAQPPVVVPRKPGSFDYMTVDAKYRRLIVAHSGNDQLAVVDMEAGAVLQQVDLGRGARSAGVAVDERDGKYFVGTALNKVVDINRKNMVLQADIGLPGPVDGIAFDPNNDTLYADERAGTRVWAINGKSDRVVETIDLQAATEFIDYDPVSNRLYQNVMPEPSTVTVIDPSTNAVLQSWPVAPATLVHGLAIDGATGRVFSVGANGKLAVLDIKTGSIVAMVDVAEKVDQLAFDPSSKRLYCPSSTGVMTVVQETDTGASVVGTVVVPRGTHNATVDPKTHAVWISFGADDNDYVQRFTPNI